MYNLYLFELLRLILGKNKSKQPPKNTNYIFLEKKRGWGTYKTIFYEWQLSYKMETYKTIF